MGRDIRRRESGQIIVLWAVCLVCIVLFAALAIDLGNTAQIHQNAQNAADSAALSGAQQLAEGSSQTAVVASVESYITTNYPQMKTPPDWTTCAGPPSGFSAPGGQNCISFNGFIVNVVIPPQLVQYWLGPVGGVNGTNVAASATASAQAPGGQIILPIGITPAAAAAGLTCIKGGSQGSNCVNNITNSAGDRGPIENPRLRSFTGTKETGHGNSNDVLELDFAVGIDHNLNVYSSSATTSYCDANVSISSATASQCSTTASPTAGAYDSASSSTYDSSSIVWSLTGGTSNVENGLVDGDTGVDAPDGGFTLAPRFAHNPSYVATGTNSATTNPGGDPLTPYLGDKASDGISYAGNLDGVQISYYLESAHGAPAAGQTEFDNTFGSNASTKCSGGANIDPTSVPVDKFTTGKNAQSVWSADDTCFTSDLTSASPPWGSGNPIFSSKIGSSPRFGFVPIVQNCGSGAAFCQITGFMAIYFDYINIQGNNLSATAWVFNPNLIQDGPAPPGQGSGGFSGNGLFVVNLCSISKGNC